MVNKEPQVFLGALDEFSQDKKDCKWVSRDYISVENDIHRLQSCILSFLDMVKFKLFYTHSVSWRLSVISYYLKLVTLDLSCNQYVS
jgi:hypothetical protein